MELKDYFRAFTLAELTEGAQLWLAGDVHQLTVTRAFAPTGAGTSMWTADGRKLQTVQVSGAVQGYEDRQQVTWQPQLTYMPQHRLVTRTACTCAAFRRDRYACPHVTALFTALLL